MRCGNLDKLRSYDTAYPCCRLFARIAAACGGEPKLFLLAKAASKNDIIGKIFIFLKNTAPLTPCSIWFQVVRELVQVICGCSMYLFENFAQRISNLSTGIVFLKFLKPLIHQFHCQRGRRHYG